MQRQPVSVPIPAATPTQLAMTAALARAACVSAAPPSQPAGVGTAHEASSASEVSGLQGRPRSRRLQPSRSPGHAATPGLRAHASSPCPRSVPICGTSVTAGGSWYRARSELCERSKRSAESPSQPALAALPLTSTCSHSRAACLSQQPRPCRLRLPAALALPACDSQQHLPCQLATPSSLCPASLRLPAASALSACAWGGW